MSNEQELEVDRMDEGLVSKTSAGVEPVTGSIPVASAVTKKKKGEIVPVPVYKLHFRRSNGDIRSDLPVALVHSLGLRWADLLRVIPAHRWSTVEEIVQFVWEWEKRQFRRPFDRSRKQIEDGVRELLEAGVLLTKPE